METFIDNELVWVNNIAKLNQMISDIMQESVVGVDTESDSLYVYKEKVCLIQISTSEIDYLIDPLALGNLQVLADFFKSESIEKIFHAAEYDIMCLKRDFGFEINTIFDTMIASRILGKKSIGLSSLLEEYFDIKVNKKYQRANWGKRPLTEEMLEYARIDSHYLIELRDILKNELKNNHLLSLANEDFQRIARTQPPAPSQLEETCWRVLKGKKITPTQAAILFELCELREKVAEKADLPPFKIMGNQTILQILLTTPVALSELKSIPGLSQKMIDRYGLEILHAVKVGQTAPPVYKRNKPKPNDDYLNLYDSLKKWRKEESDRYDVESDVILPKEIIDSIAQERPKNLDELKMAMKEVPVRFQIFGERILEEINSQEGK